MQIFRNTSMKKLYSKKMTKPWRRFLAMVLCLCTFLSLLSGFEISFPIRTLAATGDDNETYEQEKNTRQDEYKKKFDLTNLKWSGATAANGNVNYGGSARNYLYWANGSFGGVQYKNYIHVYAFEGDTICFGSNVFNSLLNEEGTATANAAQKEDIENRLGKGATVDIVLTDLRNNRIIYDVKENGVGHIPNVQTEVLAKTMESPSGNSKEVGGTTYTYKPLTYQVMETGVYTFEFHSYMYTSDVGNHRGGQVSKNVEKFYSSGNETNYDDHCALVAAWDVSVFNEQGHKETGRVYADYLSLQQNGSYNVIETYYLVTTDSYIYRWDWKGNQPNTYNFFTDNRGLTDNATGSTLYKSVKELTNAGFNYTKFGASFKYPGSVNTDLAKSYYIFFEMPNSDLEGHLYSKAIQPDPAENIRFIDKVMLHGEEVPGAYQGMGGYFAFETKESTTATLVLDFDQLTDDKGNPVLNGDEAFAPVTISGPVDPYSTNYFYWDGKDGNGVVIPPGKYNIKDILTLTTKAGEIHFPVHDMEQSSGGFTFTRVSHIYDRNGKMLDEPGTILDATKSIIYYNDSAIYYGEHVGRTGLKEDLVRTSDASSTNTQTLRQKYPGNVINDGAGGQYYRLNNMLVTSSGYAGREYDIRKSLENYVNGIETIKDPTKPFIRIGDHSHITNQIEYYDRDGNFLSSFADQNDMIDYLDSAKHPVAISAGTSGANTTDYGISDFWTFIPAQPATMEASSEIIDIIAGTAFNLTGQVFYDSNKNGIYNSMADSDTLLSNVVLRLYRKTPDEAAAAGKTYYILGSASGKVNTNDKITTPRKILEIYGGSTPKSDGAFELLREGMTSGRYFFTNIPYENGDEFVYEVVRPNASYMLTSGQTKPSPTSAGNGTYSGSYALYAYDTNGLGAEVQTITVNTDDKVDPNSNLMKEDNNTITTVDVGYYYQPHTKLTLQKTWELGGKGTAVETPIFELCYVDDKNVSHIYEERPLAQIEKLTYSYELLPKTLDGHDVKDWYVAAEYYIVGGILYKHTFKYDAITGSYESFVGSNYYIELSDQNGDGLYDQFDIEDANDDGVCDWSDLAYLDAANWKTANPVGTPPEVGSVTVPFNAVLDRNPGSAETTINITNAADPGVIEVLKYTGALGDNNFLSGATFRLYTDIPEDKGSLTIEQVQAQIDNGTDGLSWLAKRQVGSATTRTNGRITFSGLDPTRHYVLREVFAPAGYRIMETLYLVHPTDCKDFYTEETKPGTWDETTWEKWQHQNFIFAESGYVMANVANIPANGDMAIRKQINGRAWNTNDAFSFDLAFWNGSTQLEYQNDVYNYPGAIEITDSEYAIVSADAGGVEFKEKLNGFIESFSKPDGKDIIVNYLSDYARNVLSINGSQDVEVVLSDTKQSVSLIVNDDPILDEDGNPNKTNPEDAIINMSKSGATGSDDTAAQAPDPHYFPAAGTYTFTVRENSGSEGTTIYSDRVFTLVVDVTRKPDPGIDDSAELTLNNSYLHADVRQIYYQDPKDGIETPIYPSADYGSRIVYAGVAPTFTNNYHIQPAIQYTSYAIQKDFSGRLDDSGKPVNNNDDATRHWLSTDRFTVTISGADVVTQEALDNGRIYIGGLHGNTENSDKEKSIIFRQTDVINGNGTDDDYAGDVVDTGHIFNFEELDFHDLTFPVEWQFSDSAKLPPGYNVGDAVPTDTDNLKDVVIYLDDTNKYGLPAGNYFVADTANITANTLYPVEARTQDIVYSLVIKETNTGVAGVTYDECQYNMVITLKNAVNANPDHPAEAVTDGIIDEMDIVLYRLDNETAVPVQKATCETDQRVVTTFADFTNPENAFSGTELRPGGKFDQYYVNTDGVIREVEIRNGKYYVDIDGTQYEITAENFDEYKERNLTFIVKYEAHDGDHKMLFSNRYSEATTWTPKITKTLQGRDWKDDEVFTFAITPNKWPGEGDAHKPQMTGNSVNLSPANGKAGQKYETYLPTITFDCPGIYTFTVTEEADARYGMGNGRMEYGSVDITVIAKSIGGKLELDVTADPNKGDDGYLFEVNSGEITINFVNTYDETGKIPIALSKLLTGRKWTDETFTFTITPGEKAAADISNGTLNVPTEWGAFADGKYTVTIGNTVPGDENIAGWMMRTLELGEIDVGNLKTEGAVYTFTISENTDAFTENYLNCEQPEILLTITAASETGTEGGYTGNLKFVATYAYISGGDPGKEIVPTGDLVLPFVNTDTRIGSVTVEKKILNDDPSSTDPFTFTIKLKPSADKTLLPAALKITDGNGKDAAISWTTESDATITGSFTIHHGEKIIIDNVPYDTVYTVTENKTEGYNLQEVTDMTSSVGVDGNPKFDLDSCTVTGTIDAEHKNAYLLFINARAFNVPFTGGFGWLLCTVLGAALLILPLAVYLYYRKKRRSM